MTQECAHEGDKKPTELPGAIKAMLCSQCRWELAHRLDPPAFKPEETPIEYYARSGKMPRVPCRFDYNAKNKQKRPRLCGLVCDEGETLCPRHKAIQTATNEAEHRKAEAERAEAERKRAALGQQSSPDKKTP